MVVADQVFCKLFVLLLPVFVGRVSATCGMQNACSGHGTCTTATQTCVCFDGWGSSSDTTTYASGDCSQRVCPNGLAWFDLATSTTAAHATAECSNAGLCDRCTGLCTCFDGYDGDACQRKACPNNCSGHGKCISIKEMATDDTAFPLSAVTTYTGASTTTTWDEEKMYGCLCDSSWVVGLGSTDTQVAEYYGPDCSLRRCPSGNDPMTDADDTSCVSVAATGSKGTGATGNLCHVECANRGVCNYVTGTCTCFTGFYGHNCASMSAYAVQED